MKYDRNFINFAFYCTNGNRVPISFSLGIVAFAGINTLSNIPNIVIFNKMFYGLNFCVIGSSFVYISSKLNESWKISKMLIDFSVALVGHIRGGLLMQIL